MTMMMIITMVMIMTMMRMMLQDLEQICLIQPLADADHADADDHN